MAFRSFLCALIGLLLWLPIIGLIAHQDNAVSVVTAGLWTLLDPIFPVNKHAHVNYGVHDPRPAGNGPKAFSAAKGIAIEHVFISWLAPHRTSDQSTLEEMGRYAQERQRWLMITIEPYPDGNTSGAEGYLHHVAAGTYDPIIAAACRQIGALDAPVFIRWGHEMEPPQVNYPWSSQPPEDYIAAYRRFVTQCRHWVTEGYYVWSPLGYPGLADYWPGKPYADYVGVTLLTSSTLEHEHLGHALLFPDRFTPLYRLLTPFDRPIMIAELGIAGEPADQREWLGSLFRTVESFPQLKTVVYFNAISPLAWPEEDLYPDWRITAQAFE